MSIRKFVERFSSFSEETKILLAFNCIMSSLMSLKGIFIPIYLLNLGFSPILIGAFLTISTFASGISDTGSAILSDKYGRKKILLINILFSSLYYLIPLLTNNITLILVSAIFAYQGRTSSIVNALLADSSTDKKRTNLFTMKLFSGCLFGIIGPIIAGFPIIFQSYFNFDKLTSFKPLFIVCIGLTIIGFLLISNMKERIGSNDVEKVSIPRHQYNLILKFAFSHSIDTFAVGITLSIFSLWFSLRYNVDIGVVSIVFTFAQFVETFAYLSAPYIANKVGNVKGTVIIRGLGAAFLFLLAFAPTPFIAAILYAFRNSLQHISHPLRESYKMAILEKNIRASGAGISNIPRIITMSIGPSIGGYLLEISTMYPPLISGIIFGIGDVCYWLFFKDIKPPEEIETY